MFSGRHRLLVLTSTFPRWRNDTVPPFVYELSRRVAGNFAVTVHAPHYPGAAAREQVEGMDVRRFRYFFGTFEKLAGAAGILPTLRGNRLYYAVVPFFLASQFFSLLKTVKSVRPDIIHAHWLFPQGFWAVLLKRIFKIPVVVTAHGSDVFGLDARFFRAIHRQTVEDADRVTVVSSALGRFINANISKAAVPLIMPMGVDGRVFNPGANDPAIRMKYSINGPLILYVGRLTEQKGVGYLIDAMPRVLGKYPDAKLLVVGDGESRDSLEKKIRGMSLDARVILTGAISNSRLPAYYAEADIFVGPSVISEHGEREGFGLAFVEAGMSGCLLVGTDTGGITDIIQHGVTGYLVPQRASAELAERILYGLDNKDETERLKVRCRKRCMKLFDWENIATKYMELLAQTLPV